MKVMKKGWIHVLREQPLDRLRPIVESFRARDGAPLSLSPNGAGVILDVEIREEKPGMGGLWVLVDLEEDHPGLVRFAAMATRIAALPNLSFELQPGDWKPLSTWPPPRKRPSLVDTGVLMDSIRGAGLTPAQPQPRSPFDYIRDELHKKGLSLR